MVVGHCGAWQLQVYICYHMKISFSYNSQAIISMRTSFIGKQAHDFLALLQGHTQWKWQKWFKCPKWQIVSNFQVKGTDVQYGRKSRKNTKIEMHLHFGLFVRQNVIKNRKSCVLLLMFYVLFSLPTFQFDQVFIFIFLFQRIRSIFILFSLDIFK